MLVGQLHIPDNAKEYFFLFKPSLPELLIGSARLVIVFAKNVPFGFAASFPGETLLDASPKVVISVVVAAVIGNIKLLHFGEGK